MTDFIPNTQEYILLKTKYNDTEVSGEGSKILKINNYYYIFIICWSSNLRRIELCYCSKNLLGDYEGKTILNSCVMFLLLWNLMK